MSSFPEEIEGLVAIGFAVHWLHPREKRPIGNDWQDKAAPTVASLRPGYNVGVRLGLPSRIGDRYLILIDVDVRKPSAEAEAMGTVRKMFPRHATFAEVISGSGGCHLYLVTDKPFASRKLASGDGWEIELFGTGKQAAMPPSIHPNGKPYVWKRPFDDMAEILGSHYMPAAEIEALIGKSRSEEISSIDDSHCDPEVAREMRALAGNNVSDDEVLGHLGDLTGKWCDDHDSWLKAGMSLHDYYGGTIEARDKWFEWSKQSANFDLRESMIRWKSFGKRKRANPIGIGSLIEMANKANPERRHLADAENSDANEEEKTSIEVKEEEKSDEKTPRFPIEMFGRGWAQKIKFWADATGSAPDFAAASLLTSAAAVIGNSHSVQIRKNWREPCALWTILLGAPSTNKSPALSIFSCALRELEKEWAPAYGEKLRDYEANKKRVAALHKEYERLCAEAAKNGTAMPESTLEPMPAKPTPRRVVSATQP